MADLSRSETSHDEQLRSALADGDFDEVRRLNRIRATGSPDPSVSLSGESLITDEMARIALCAYFGRPMDIDIQWGPGLPQHMRDALEAVHGDIMEAAHNLRHADERAMTRLGDRIIVAENALREVVGYGAHHSGVPGVQAKVAQDALDEIERMRDA